jgi:anhydro-N-acetylmuramic acid kinase
VNRVERLIEVSRKKQRVVIGLMSGTSVDAIDAVVVRITGHAPGAKIEKIRFGSYPFPEEIRTRINTLFDKEKARIEEICHLDFVLGELFAAAANRVIADAGMTNDEVDLSVAWVGKTVATRSTLAIGQAAVIAERTGILTIGDLRVRDVAAGGHGAPLVAYFDWAQLRDSKKARAMQNIGGIANVTYVPPGAELDDVLAFDTGPGNMIIDALVYILSDGTETFDRNGARAVRGAVNEEILQWCMSDPYFQLRPPKTTGRERFGRQFARRIVDRFAGTPFDDLIATATAFTAESIAQAYQKFIGRPVDEMIVAGGGAKNPTLLRMLRERLPECEIRVYEHLQEKEAMAMALIANDSLGGQPTNVPSATGGQATILGKICL